MSDDYGVELDGRRSFSRLDPDTKSRSVPEADDVGVGYLVPLAVVGCACLVCCYLKR